MGFNAHNSSRKTLGDDAYRELKEKIVSLQLKPGEMIYENAVASSFGISRTPVREAFNRLEQEELINILPQRGACVAFLSEKKIKEAQFIRETLELRMFKIIAQNWDVHDEKYQKAEQVLLALIEEQKRSVRKGDYIEFIRLDAEFHTRILELEGNSTLLQVLSVMRAHMNRMRYLELQVGRHEWESIGHHEQLLQLLIRGDVENTEKTLLYHLRLIVNDWPRIIEKYSEYFKKT